MPVAGPRKQLGKRADNHSIANLGLIVGEHGDRERRTRISDQSPQRGGAARRRAEVLGLQHVARLDRDGAHFPFRVGEADVHELAAERQHSEHVVDRKCCEGAPQKGGRRRMRACVHAT